MVIYRRFVSKLLRACKIFAILSKKNIKTTKIVFTKFYILLVLLIF